MSARPHEASTEVGPRSVDDSLRRDARAACAEIAAGRLRGRALFDRIASVPYADRDVWVDELLGMNDPPPDLPDLPRGCVPYLPCGVEEILAMVRDVPLRADDELVDLGAGLGRVVLLVHLLTGVRARGIEIQGPLVRRARACSAAVAAEGVSFVHADAAESDLVGSVFFLYAPFNGSLLERVLRNLGAVARRRTIVVCAVGLELHERWLVPRTSSSAALAIYHSTEPSTASVA